MKVDQFGVVYFSENDICELLYQNPSMDIKNYTIDRDSQFNSSNKKLHAGLSNLRIYNEQSISIEEFDQTNQQNWLMPQQYIDFDIETWLLTKCNNNIERDRVSLELDLFKQTNLLPLVKYLKYLVDVMIKNNIVWGVGRGSSTASYILYLIGLHMIDPIKYNIPIDEFFKKE